MSNLSDLLPAGAGGKNVSFTANGTISQGDALILESSGQVTPVTESSQSAGANSGQVGETQAVEMSAQVFDPTRQYLVVAYRNDNNNNYGQGKGFQPNGNTGSNASFNAGNTYLLAGSGATTNEKKANYLSGTFDSANNYVVFVWRDGNNSATAVTGIADFNPTFNAISTAIGSGVNYTPEICYDSTNQKVVIISTDLNSNCMNYNVGTINANGTFTFGSAVTGFAPIGASVNYYQPHVVFDSTNSKVCLSFMDGSGNLYSSTGTVSGNSISWGTPYNYTSTYQGAPTTNPDFKFAYDPIGNMVIGVFRSANNNNYPVLLNLRYNTSTFRYEQVTAFSIIQSTQLANGTCGAAYSSLAKKVIITYRYNNGFIIGQSISVSGNTITQDAQTNVHQPSGSIEYVSLAANDVTGTFGQASIFFKNNNASNRGELFSYTPAVTATNVNDGFIGIADENIANAATGSVTVKGGIAANGLSGLTPNANYYVANDGTISTTSTGLKIGKALSTSSINLEFQT